MKLKIIIGVLCIMNFAFFVYNPSKYMLSGMVCGMLFTDLLWLIKRD